MRAVDRAQRSGADPKRGGTRRARETAGPEHVVSRIARDLREDARFGPYFGHWHVVPARAERSAAFPKSVDQRIVELYARQGVRELYEHQARCIDAALAGEDVLVATPTASGKTLCYAVPVLQALLGSGGSARSLFLFPTKALGQDQAFHLTSRIEALGEDWHAFTYDGDTPPSVRRNLRDRGHLVLTNPWMLHAGILPNHAKWSELFRDLRFIVIDEVHTLSGVFGSSVANVLRRLVRIARHYGSDPRFVCTSATLSEPALHAQRLLGRSVRVISEDGSPSGERVFGVYNPPLLNAVAGLRANALEEARRLAEIVCGPEHQTIFFCRRRTAVEVLTRYLKESAASFGLRGEEIRGYRGGYLPLLRREIEDGLREGSVKVVVSTSALELGIDIGALDVAVLVGYPGSQASFWQRAGRVGRRQKPSLVVQVAQSDPVDQYLAEHPEYLFGAPQERLGLDPNNLVILSEQLKCAAFELPFRSGRTASDVTDATFQEAPHVAGILDYLTEEAHILHRRDGAWYWMADAYPAQDVSLSGESPDNVLVLDVETKRAIGEVDRATSITTVHDGAIYQVEGETWIVERFDHKNRRAYVRAVESDYFTEAEVDTEVRVVRLEARSARIRDDGAHAVDARVFDGEGRPRHHLANEDYSVWRGEVHVTTLATQYKKIRFYTRENVGAEDIHLPAEELDTEAFVLTISAETASRLSLYAGDRGAAWRGVGNLLRRMAPLYISSQPKDIGLCAEVRSAHFLEPALCLYDSVQGGVGLAELIFDGHRAMLAAAHEVLSSCRCVGGCPACIGPPTEVGSHGKSCALAILAHLSAGRGPERVELGADGLAGDT